MKDLLLFACGLFDGDASEFSEGNTKLGVRSSFVPKRQEGDSGSV